MQVVPATATASGVSEVIGPETETVTGAEALPVPLVLGVNDPDVQLTDAFELLSLGGASLMVERR
jgi:hypothetical protein